MLFVDNKGQVLFVPAKFDYKTRRRLAEGKSSHESGVFSALHRFKKRSVFVPYLEHIEAWYRGEKLPDWFHVPSENQRDAMERATATATFGTHRYIWHDSKEREKQIPWEPGTLRIWVRRIFAGESIPIEGKYVIPRDAQSIRRQSVARKVVPTCWSSINKLKRISSAAEALREIEDLTTNRAVEKPLKNNGDSARHFRSEISLRTQKRTTEICEQFSHARTRRAVERYSASYAKRFDRAGVSRSRYKDMLKEAELAGGKIAWEELRVFMDGAPTMPGRNVDVFWNRPIDSLVLINLAPGVWDYADRAQEAGKGVWADGELLRTPCFWQWLLAWLGLENLAKSEPPKLDRARKCVVLEGGETVRLGKAQYEVVAALIRARPNHMTSVQLTGLTGVANPPQALRRVREKLPNEQQNAIGFPGLDSRGYSTILKFL